MYGKILHFTTLEIDNEDEIDEKKNKKLKTTIDIQNGDLNKKDVFRKISTEKEEKIAEKYKLRKEFLQKLQNRLEQIKRKEQIGLV